MKIYRLEKTNRSKWNDYVEKNPDATFYHRVEWEDIIEKSFGHDTYYLMAEENNKTLGILPLVHLKSYFFGSILCSMPFLNFGGACADDDSIQIALYNRAKEILLDSKGDYIEIRNLKKSIINTHQKTHKVSMTISLDKDPDVLWNKFKSKHRTNIRRACKNGLEIHAGGLEYLDDFYKIISTGWRDLGTPIYHKIFFKNILNLLGDSIQIYFVKYQGNTIATAMNGLFKDTVEGMWIYSLKEYAKLQTNYFLYWEMIKHACMDGFKTFHLGRSTSETGATFYKKKWNAETKQLYWEYLLGRKKEIPELDVDNPKYQLAINLWKKMPVRLTQIIGPYLSKSIP